ncbi:hypothetical protein [Candidatus Sororendozoicomonas aggregata]|uniref:hypothetical protein n=1 Tax=Candidatus Sororendozoicomonas aggregata TaxID=3073239 RepID=UPI002ED156B7
MLINGNHNNQTVKLLKDTSQILFAGILGTLYIVVDQAFSSKISSDYFRADSFIAYYPMVFAFIAKVIGHSSVILIRKEPGSSLPYMVGGLSLSIISSSLFLLLIASTSSYFFHISSISHILGVSEFFLIQGIAGVFFCSSHVMRYMLIAKEKMPYILKVEILGNSFNFLGNFLFLYLLDNEAHAFIGFAITTLIVQTSTFLIYKRKLGVSILNKFLFKKAKSFLRRSKKIVTGDSIYMLLVTLSPLFFALIIQEKTTSSIVIAFNTGVTIYTFFSRPFISILLSGVSFISSNKEISIDDKLKVINKLSFFLLGVVLFLMVIFGYYVIVEMFNVKEYFWVTLIVIGLIFPLSLSVSSVCIIRISENNLTMAFSELVATYIIGMPIIYFFSNNENFIAIFIIGYFIPFLVNHIFYIWYSKDKKYKKAMLKFSSSS